MPRLRQLSVAALALLLAAACSSVGAGAAGSGPTTSLALAARVASSEPEPAPRAVAHPPAPASALPASVSFTPPGAAPNGDQQVGRARRAPPLTVLNQMVTTQALLVSLLLSPLSGAAQEPRPATAL